MKPNVWLYYAFPRGHERSAFVKRGNKIIAEVFTDREPGDQYQTADLFAAAPAMLEALQNVLDLLSREQAEVVGAQVIARAAIARAPISQAQQGQ